jgi:hypothetical protein
VEDGNLVTGQNQNAGPMVARLMMARVLEKQERATRSLHDLFAWSFAHAS